MALSNTKEKNKKLLQFIILMVLPLLMMLGIFLSYKKPTVGLSDEYLDRINKSKVFNEKLEPLTDKILLIDSNLNVLANNTSNLGTSQLKTTIELNSEELLKIDNSEITQSLHAMIRNHLNHLIDLNTINKELKNTNKTQ
jgi:hypothetical protein